MSEPQLLGDRYELGEVIGRGGMAEVRRGRDSRLGRIVALKMLRVDHAADATFQARFRREAQSAASLNHRNIVAVYDTGEDDVDGHRVPYIVMEYVEGKTVREMVRDQVRFTPERSIEIVSATLDALEYSHRAGIVHRDIKPGNIMITSSGEVKVMDFGIARSLADTGMALTQTAAVVGTAQYISPEQARGEQADARSDLYACGCVMYELLAGRPPFVGESLVSVAVSHVREMAPPPSALDPSVPPELDAIVMKSLAKGREERYQSAYEMRADLQRAASGLPVAAYADTSATTQLMGAAPPQAYDNTNVMDDDTYDELEDDEEEPKGVSWWAVILGALAVLAIAGLVGFLIFRSDGQPQVTVPTLVGETEDAAVELLESRDLVPVVDSQETSDADQVGNVLSQDPQPNTQLDEGSSVTLVVGIEPGMIQVPSVEGRTQEQAEQMIQDQGLALGNVSRVNSEEDEGIVLSTDPEGGTAVPPDTAVNLEISTGVADVEVPELIGTSRVEAESELARLGLESNVQRETTGDAPHDQVIDQTPDPGTTLEEGGTVTIIVAERPEEGGDQNGGEENGGDQNGGEENGTDQGGTENGGDQNGTDQGNDQGTENGGDQNGGEENGGNEGWDQGQESGEEGTETGTETGTDDGTDNGNEGGLIG